jgi:hypothetical protein
MSRQAKSQSETELAEKVFRWQQRSLQLFINIFYVIPMIALTVRLSPYFRSHQAWLTVFITLVMLSLIVLCYWAFGIAWAVLHVFLLRWFLPSLDAQDARLLIPDYYQRVRHMISGAVAINIFSKKNKRFSALCLRLTNWAITRAYKPHDR